MEFYFFVWLCTLSVALIGGISTFIWQLVLSRNREFNEQAQLSALSTESSVLEGLRVQLEDNKRFDAHYQVLTANKESIVYIDEKIDALLEKKSASVAKYAEQVKLLSARMINNDNNTVTSHSLMLLKQEAQSELQAFEAELQQLQTAREKLWGISSELLFELVHEETARNKRLDELYSRHTELLEKVYLGHAQSVERIHQASIEAGSKALQQSLAAPVETMSTFWQKPTASHGQYAKHVEQELASRRALQQLSKSYNDADYLENQQSESIPSLYQAAQG